MSSHGFYSIFHLNYGHIVELKDNEHIDDTIQIFSCGWVEIKTRNIWDWSSRSMVKSSGFSSRDPGFNSQHPLGSSQ